MQKPARRPEVLITLCMVLLLVSCTDNGSQAKLDEEVAELSHQLTLQSEEVTRLSDEVATQAEEITNLQRQSAELRTGIDSVSELAQRNAVLPTDPAVEARLAALETMASDNSSVLGRPGNFADGLWADMEAVLDCLNEILERGGVAPIPNNSCRLIDAGMMGGY